MKDPRFFPKGRDRVYLSPAHMDFHAGGHGFFVEKMGGADYLGYYDSKLGTENAVKVNLQLARSFRMLAREAAELYGESCGAVCENAMAVEIRARERAVSYVPDSLDQRPPLEVSEPRMHHMLESALIHGYASGSVGATFEEQDDHFVYEVTYTIKRKRRKGIHVGGLGVVKT